MTDTALQASASWPAIEKAIQLLIDSRRSENTRIAYRADWQKWISFVRLEGGDLVVPGLSLTTSFRDQLSPDYSSKSTNRILGTLSFLYGALRDAGLVRANPFARAWLPRPEVSDLKKTPAVDDDVVLKLEQSIAPDKSAQGRRAAAIVRILYDTGIRRASLATMRRDQLRREGDTVSVIVVVKGGTEHEAVFTQGAAAALAAWLKVAPASPYVFPGPDPEQPISLYTVNNVLTARAKACGLTSNDVHPHRFRAAFITAAYDAKLYERDIQAAAHHARAETTRGYDRGARGADVYDKVAEFRKEKKKP